MSSGRHCLLTFLGLIIMFFSHQGLAHSEGDLRCEASLGYFSDDVAAAKATILYMDTQLHSRGIPVELSSLVTSVAVRDVIRGDMATVEEVSFPTGEAVVKDNISIFGPDQSIITFSHLSETGRFFGVSDDGESRQALWSISCSSTDGEETFSYAVVPENRVFVPIVFTQCFVSSYNLANIHTASNCRYELDGGKVQVHTMNSVWFLDQQFSVVENLMNQSKRVSLVKEVWNEIRERDSEWRGTVNQKLLNCWNETRSYC